MIVTVAIVVASFSIAAVLLAMIYWPVPDDDPPDQPDKGEP